MGPQADRLLRLMVLHEEPAEHFDLAELKGIAQGTPTELPTRLVAGNTGWAAEAG